jgi:adenylate cyclase
MCTDEMFSQARKFGEKQGTTFSGRILAQVAVVGKKEAVTVWEPMSEETFKNKEAIIRRFDIARDLFYAGKFAEALPLFLEIEEADSPAGFYAEQCRCFIERPGEWKGYWESKSK